MTPRGEKQTPDVAALRTMHVITGTLYALGMAAVAGWAAWPVYADGRFIVLAAVAAVAALAVSVAATLWRWQGWLTGVVALAAFLAIGLAVAVPPNGVAGLPLALRELASGLVTGWKDLVTVDLPVGAYRNLLVPALVVFLGGTLATLRLAWRPDRVGSLAAPVALGMTSFGLLFGRTATSAAITIGPLTVPAPRELACAALALVLSLAWLAWRTAAWRRAALRRAADTSGVRLSRRRSGSDARRGVLAAGMVVVAVVIGAVVAPAVAEGRTRDVLRSGIGPAQAISRAVTPLTDYRTNFADAVVNQPLFTVSAVAGRLPDRIRLATLSAYDGAAYRVADDLDGSFVRVPARRTPDTGTSSSVRVRIDALRGIWLPTFGSLSRLQYAGRDATSRADAFYYDAEGRAAVQTDGLAAGEEYVVTATTERPAALATLKAPGDDPQVVVPDSVKSWIEKQDAGTDGAALQVLVERLRERGYLSHALQVPDGGARWMSALGAGYVFQPSASGHSLARIDAMFRRLLAREASADTGSLVAAVGDDEQFAVAVALIAQELGFPSRVVVGARLTAEPGDVPACDGGVCTGGNITAWTEVRSAAGTWVPVDVTPQHTQGAENTLTRQRDPENPTEVRPENAEQVDPPDPTRQESNDNPTRSDEKAGLDGLFATLRVVGIAGLGALLVAGPFLVILLAKAGRRRSRRGEQAPASRIAGGWDEYVDTAVDHGMPAPGVRTRSELASAYATPHGATLAVAADRAVFSDEALGDGDAAAFWAIVDEERRRMSASRPLWRRMLAAVSLKSFVRGLGPRTPRRRRRGGERTTSAGAQPAAPGALGARESTERRGRAQHASPADS